MKDFALFIAILLLAFWLFREDRQKALGISRHHIDTRSFPLKKGKKGQEVLRLREWLHKNYNLPFVNSTVFDEQLEDDLQRILKRNNISCAYYTKNKIY